MAARLSHEGDHREGRGHRQKRHLLRNQTERMRLAGRCRAIVSGARLPLEFAAVQSGAIRPRPDAPSARSGDRAARNRAARRRTEASPRSASRASCKRTTKTMPRGSGPVPRSRSSRRPTATAVQTTCSGRPCAPPPRRPIRRAADAARRVRRRMRCETVAAWPGENREQHARICRMQQDVREVISAGARTEDLGVEHQREPGERNPIAVMEFRKAPHEIPQRDAPLDVQVVADVNGIVEEDKVEAPDLPVDQEDGGDQQSRQNQRSPPSPKSIPPSFPENAAPTRREFASATFPKRAASMTKSGVGVCAEAYRPSRTSSRAVLHGQRSRVQLPARIGIVG